MFFSLIVKSEYLRVDLMVLKLLFTLNLLTNSVQKVAISRFSSFISLCLHRSIFFVPEWDAMPLDLTWTVCGQRGRVLLNIYLPIMVDWFGKLPLVGLKISCSNLLFSTMARMWRFMALACRFYLLSMCSSQYLGAECHHQSEFDGCNFDWRLARIRRIVYSDNQCHYF